MSALRVTNALQDIMNLCTFGDFSLKSTEGIACHCFGIGQSSIVIRGIKNVRRFEDILNQIWAVSKDLQDSYTKDVITNEVISIIRDCHFRNITPDDSLTQNWLQELTQVNLVNWTVFRGIRGIILPDGEPRQLGPFTLYTKERYKAQIPKIVQTTIPELDAELEKPDEFIAVDIISRSGDRAIERADVHFLRFQNVVRYMIGTRNSRYHVGIIDKKVSWKSHAHAVSTKSMIWSSGIEGPRFPIDLTDPDFTAKENGNATIWKLLCLSDNNELQNRIISAVDWIGKAVNEVDDANALIQSVFALESVLQLDTGIFRPSIVANIAETAAFLLEKTCEKRCEIERMIKSIYEARSAIVHGGRAKVSFEQANNALSTTKEVIVSMLVHPEISKFSCMKELERWVKKQRYS